MACGCWPARRSGLEPEAAYIFSQGVFWRIEMTTTDWIVLVGTPPLLLLAVAWGAVLLAPWLNRHGW